MLNLRGMRFPIDVILVCIRWYATYPLSYWHLEEMMEKRGVYRSTTRRSTGGRAVSCRLSKRWPANTSIQLAAAGAWTRRILGQEYLKYLYRTVDTQGKTVDFLLTAKRDMVAAKRFFDKAMGANGDPCKVAMDKAAIDAINAERDVPIVVRQVKYPNNIVEQDHGAIKRVTRPMRDFKSFWSAAAVLAGVELMHMICKGRSPSARPMRCRLTANFMP